VSNKLNASVRAGSALTSLSVCAMPCAARQRKPSEAKHNRTRTTHPQGNSSTAAPRLIALKINVFASAHKRFLKCVCVCVRLIAHPDDDEPLHISWLPMMRMLLLLLLMMMMM
jgi:hypothetical protein